MKKLLLTVAAAFAIAASAAAQKASPAVEKAVTNAEQQWADAAKAGDADKLAPLFADDMTSINSDGTLTTKSQELDALRSGKVKYTDMSNSDMQVRSYGNIAIVTGIVSMSGTNNGKDISGRYRFTDVWRSNSGKWQCVATEATATK